MPCVKYWKWKESVEAKVTRNKDGELIMQMVGEDHDFPGFPRGHLLFGKLSKLKHEIKNQVFNYAWKKLEEKTPEKEIIKEIKGDIFNRIFTLAEDTKYDRVPPEKMHRAVKEIYRAWTKIATSERSRQIRDLVTFILQEDDGYRFRVQWIASYFSKWRPIKSFSKSLSMLEQAEVIGDMKDKQKLLKRVLLCILKDPSICRQFFAFYKELDMKKLKLSEADKYHFRGKYFRVDYELFDY